eukprot:5293783-Prymnesium_polylepis.1
MVQGQQSCLLRVAVPAGRFPKETSSRKSEVCTRVVSVVWKPPQPWSLKAFEPMLTVALASSLSLPATGTAAPHLSLEKHQLRALYDLGQDITLCWATQSGTSTREDCRGAYMEFTYSWPSTMLSDQEYPVSYRMHVPTNLGTSIAVPHSNLHSCLRNNSESSIRTPTFTGQPARSTKR